MLPSDKQCDNPKHLMTKRVCQMRASWTLVVLLLNSLPVKSEIQTSLCMQESGCQLYIIFTENKSHKNRKDKHSMYNGETFTSGPLCLNL